ncbi:MAG: DUF4832 domain-containing protein [Candidatus Cryptobacteroides sp.]|nr:DUF4832 domain-containing protein [Bacteroidales bacterium]
MRLFRIFIIAIALLAGGCTASIEKEAVYFQEDTVKVLRNPLSGWVMYLGRSFDENFWEQYGYDNMPTSEGTEVRVSDYAVCAYIRTSWSSLEPEEGHYAWDDPDSRLNRLLQSCLARDMRLAFRIVVDGRDQGQNTPLYVRDAGAEGFTSRLGEKEVFTPYADDPVFQEKYSAFIHALATYFNDPDKMEFIDAYGLGKWGEGHAVVYKDNANKIPVFEWITSLYTECFTKIPLLVHYHRVLGDPNQDSYGEVSPDTEGMLASCIDKGYSLRHDAFGMTGYYEDWEKEYAARWRFRRPIVMEGGWITGAHHRYWRDPSGKYREGHSEDVRLGEFEASAEGHVNMMDFRINDETRSWFGTSFDLVKRFIAEGGYRLYPDMAAAPSSVKSGSKATVISRWNNSGWGYCPNNIPQWNYKYKVAAAVLDEDGNPVRLAVDEQSDPSKWLKGSPYTSKVKISTEGLAPGTYRWAAGIVDTSRDNIAGLELALPGTDIAGNGWAVIKPFTVN